MLFRSVTFTYDAMARMVSRAGAPVGGTWTYAWDPMGRLAEVVRPDGVHVSYRYDTWGERVEKVVGTTVTRYYRSGWFFLELDEDDTVLRTTMFGGDGTTPLWVMQGGTVAYVHRDHLGTPMLLTDATGAIVWHARFAPWGKADVLIGSFDQPWRFPDDASQAAWRSARIGALSDDQVIVVKECFRHWQGLLDGEVDQELIGEGLRTIDRVLADRPKQV